jgi:hypothetical protein
MEKIADNINKFLPFGESLRNILQHPSIKKPDLKKLLRQKGIFVENTEDETTFPLLTTSLLSPFEFEFLKEKLQTREDREKTITRSLDWESDQTLITAIPDNFNVQEVIKTVYPRYKIVGTPNFKMVENNPNRISLDFKCETENYSKEWFRAKNEFKGQVTLEKINTGNKVQLQIIHTSPETTEISNKVVKHLERHFKTNNYMDPVKEIHKIQYNSFSNDERIRFFLSFTDGNDVFEFERGSYLDIGPDPNENLPDGIDWLQLAKVNELSINGEGLHNIHFIKNQDLHKYMELCEMELIYNFSIPSAEGNCRIRFGFPNYFYRRITSIEFEVDIIKINLKDDYSSLPVNSVRSALLKEFEKFKSQKYDWFRLQTLNTQFTPPA